MSKRKSPSRRTPPVVCPQCKADLAAPSNPTDRVIHRPDCTRCEYSFNFSAYRQACKIRALNDLANDPHPAPLQSLIPGAG